MRNAGLSFIGGGRYDYSGKKGEAFLTGKGGRAEAATYGREIASTGFCFCPFGRAGTKWTREEFSLATRGNAEGIGEESKTGRGVRTNQGETAVYYHVGGSTNPPGAETELPNGCKGSASQNPLWGGRAYGDL